MVPTSPTLAALLATNPSASKRVTLKDGTVLVGVCTANTDAGDWSLTLVETVGVGVNAAPRTRTWCIDLPEVMAVSD